MQKQRRFHPSSCLCNANYCFVYIVQYAAVLFNGVESCRYFANPSTSCGPNTACSNDSCVCQSGCAEFETGSAATPDGCCVDTCNGPGTACDAGQCVCKSGFFEDVAGDAATVGCCPDTCPGPGTECVNAECVCAEGFQEENVGDALTATGCVEIAIGADCTAPDGCCAETCPGENTVCNTGGICSCAGNFAEATPGDASTSTGCTVPTCNNGTPVPANGCCDETCPYLNSKCIDGGTCVCEDGFGELIEGDVSYGCLIICPDGRLGFRNGCCLFDCPGPNAYCTTGRECVCAEPYFEANPGDVSTEVGCTLCSDGSLVPSDGCCPNFCPAGQTCLNSECY